MRGEYAKTLRSMGIRIRDMLVKIAQEPLPEPLADLLHRLVEREYVGNDKQSKNEKPQNVKVTLAVDLKRLRLRGVDRTPYIEPGGLKARSAGRALRSCKVLAAQRCGAALIRCEHPGPS